MNLNTITALRHPRSATEIAEWRDSFAWLAGGTWLFSEPQPAIDTLVDLGRLGWPALEVSSAGLDIAATCQVAELFRFEAPKEWIAAPLLGECCNAFLASFKIWNAATVGGNICMSLPAGPMISLSVALEATYTLWPRGSAPREVPAIDFVTGNHSNVLRPGELYPSARGIAVEARRAPPRIAHQARPLRGADHRNAERGAGRFADHDHCGHAMAGAVSVRPDAVLRRATPGPR
jgi:hypothetical protein